MLQRLNFFKRNRRNKLRAGRVQVEEIEEVRVQEIVGVQRGVQEVARSHDVVSTSSSESAPLSNGRHLWLIQNGYVTMGRDGELLIERGEPNQNYGPSE